MYGQGSIAIFFSWQDESRKATIESINCIWDQASLVSNIFFWLPAYPRAEIDQTWSAFWPKNAKKFCILKLAATDSELWLSCGRQNLAERGGCEDNHKKVRLFHSWCDCRRQQPGPNYVLLESCISRKKELYIFQWTCSSWPRDGWLSKATVMNWVKTAQPFAMNWSSAVRFCVLLTAGIHMVSFS